MNTSDEIYSDIIKSESLFFRGVELGASLDQVEEKEGMDYDKVTGSLPHYEYYVETGEMEEIFMYYGFKTETQKVDYIRLFLYTYPKIYWENAGGNALSEFFDKVHNQQIAEYTTSFDHTMTKIINHFTSILGTPKLEELDEVFSKPYHEFKKYSWVKDAMMLSISSYIDDTKEGSVKKVLQLFLRNK